MTALGVGEDGEPDPVRENSLWDASWQQAIAFQRELLAMAGWPDCRAAYEENLQKAKDRAAYCQQLLDHPQRGGQGSGRQGRSRHVKPNGLLDHLPIVGGEGGIRTVFETDPRTLCPKPREKVALARDGAHDTPIVVRLRSIAGDVTAAKTEADCKAAGGMWDAATNTCAE